MAFVIESGDENSYKAIVTNKGRLITKGVSEDEELHSNEADGEAYSFITMDVNATTIGNKIAYLKNTSNNIMLMSSIRVNSAGNGNTMYSLLAACDGTPSGTTTNTPVNRHIVIGNDAEGVFYEGNAIASLTGGSTVGLGFVEAGKAGKLSFNSNIIIRKNQNLVVRALTSGVTFDMTISLHWQI